MEELKIAIIVIIVEAAYWFLQKLWTKRTDETNRKKVEADGGLADALADKTGAEAIAILLESIEKLESKRSRDSDKSDALEQTVKEQGEELEKILSQNENLLETVNKQESQISEIEKENKTLRDMFLNEQLNGRTLKQGVRRLIAQLKEMNIKPIFEIE